MEKKMRHATRATMYDNMAQLDPPKGTGVVPENRFVEKTIIRLKGFCCDGTKGPYRRMDRSCMLISFRTLVRPVFPHLDPHVTRMSAPSDPSTPPL